MTRFDANEDVVSHYRWDVALDPDEPDFRWIRVAGGDLPCDIGIRIGKPSHGRIICTGLRVGAPDGVAEEYEYEVTSRMLRDIRLGGVLQTIKEGVGGVSDDMLTFWDTEGDVERVARLGEWAKDFPGMGGRTLGELMGGKAKNLSVRRGRKGLDSETLRRTAEVYRQAIADGATQPLAVAAQQLDIHPSTVWRRLQSAWKRFPELEPKRATDV